MFIVFYHKNKVLKHLQAALDNVSNQDQSQSFKIIKPSVDQVQIYIPLQQGLILLN